ncbi:non-heme iron oxygenase ferredoxin subunit [Ornithinimicrobium sp. Arc0846-15]|nr:non-heme iron oxygenase ferredoxin subunit [Ornithinimicrobium laminariae]
MAEFTKVCSLADLPNVGAVCADFDGRRVAIARDSSGAVHAFDDTCSHAKVSLSEGDVEDDVIECWLHGSGFNMKTGKPTSLPATEPIAVHTVQIEGDDVYVALSDSFKQGEK